MANSSVFSNHGNVLLVLSADPESRLRDVAAKVGITERAVQKIVRDLQDEGIVSVHKHGRRNRYRINTRKVLHHPLSSNRTVGQLLNLMRDGPARAAPEQVKNPSPRKPETREAVSIAVTASPNVPARESAEMAGSSASAEAEPAPTPEAVAEKDPARNSDSDTRKKKKRTGARPDDQQGSLF